MHESLLSLFDLSGKSAVVTGCSRGLGISFARGLAKAGCNLVVSARNGDQLKNTARDLEQYGTRAVPVVTDVRDPAQVDAMIATAVREFGRIDILVNNAGISAVVDAENMTSDQWHDVIDTNLTSAFRCAQAAGRRMLAQGSGKIINIASMYGISASSCVSQVSYVSSKAGLLGLTRELAVEWAPKGLHVVALAPGFFRSDQTVWAFEQNQELGSALLAKVPAGRLGRLEELEGTIVYLASKAADYMNGQALIIDGGFLCW